MHLLRFKLFGFAVKEVADLDKSWNFKLICAQHFHDEIGYPAVTCYF